VYPSWIGPELTTPCDKASCRSAILYLTGLSAEVYQNFLRVSCLRLSARVVIACRRVADSILRFCENQLSRGITDELFCNVSLEMFMLVAVIILTVGFVCIIPIIVSSHNMSDYSNSVGHFRS
jgi:hypothetical protein